MLIVMRDTQAAVVGRDATGEVLWCATIRAVAVGRQIGPKDVEFLAAVSELGAEARKP